MDQVVVPRQHHRRGLQPADLIQEPLQNVVGDPLVVEHITHQQQQIAAVMGHRIDHRPQRVGRLGMAGGVAQMGV